jgi:hypothetical protein
MLGYFFAVVAAMVNLGHASEDLFIQIMFFAGCLDDLFEEIAFGFSSG